MPHSPWLSWITFPRMIVPVGKGGIAPVDVRLQLADQEPQVRIGTNRPAVDPAELGVLDRVQGLLIFGRHSLERFLRQVLDRPLRTCIGNANDDDVANRSFVQQSGDGLVDAPLLAVPGCRGIPQALAVVHVQHGIPPFFVITRRQPHEDIPAGNVVRFEIFDRDQVPRRNLGFGFGRGGRKRPAGQRQHEQSDQSGADSRHSGDCSQCGFAGSQPSKIKAPRALAPLDQGLNTYAAFPPRPLVP